MKIQKFNEFVNEKIMNNISKKRKFPTYKETEKDVSKDYLDNVDMFFIYKISKKDIGKYLNTWFIGDQHHNSKTGDIYSDEIITVKKVDKETSYCLYDKIYNPVSIDIMCPSGAKFIINEKGEKLYNMKAMIHSIDDSSFGAWFNNKPLEELKEIREKLMNWVNSYKVINGKKWIEYCKELGTDAIDYN